MNTYDPYEVLPRPTVGIFAGLPSAQPGTVLVVDREGHPVRALKTHSDRLTAGEARFGRIRTLYRVDVAERPLAFEETFPCADDIGGFRADVRLTCQVDDPEAVVRRGIRDVAGILVPLVCQTLRRACREFAAEDQADAEEAAVASVHAMEADGGHDASFRIRHVSITLTLDEAAATYVRERKETQRNLVRQQDRARLEEEKTALEAALTRQREELEAQRARMTSDYENERLTLQKQTQQIEAELATQKMQLDHHRNTLQARAEHESASDLELRRLEFEQSRQAKEAELARQGLELAIERSRLEAQKELQETEARLAREQLYLDRYRELLSAGEYGMVALRLLQEPGSVAEVSAALARQHAADADRQLEALRVFLDNDALEGWQITDEAKKVLKQLVDRWSRDAGQKELGSGAGTPVPPDPAAAEIVLPPQDSTAENDTNAET